MPAGASITRASAGEWWDAGGVLRAAPAGTARIDRHPVTGVVRGLLLEAERTNLLPEARELTRAHFSSQLVLVSDAGAGIDGVQSADLAMPDATLSSSHFTRGTFASVAGTTYAYHRILSASGHGIVRMRMQVGFTGTATFDLANGTIVSTTGQAVASIEPMGGGRWLCAVIDQCNQTSETNRALLEIFDSPALAAYAGNGVAGIIHYHAQVEAGGSVSSPIATLAAPATRAGETLRLDWGALGVADGAIAVRIVGEGQTVGATMTVSAGIATTGPVAGCRHIRRIERV